VLQAQLPLVILLSVTLRVYNLRDRIVDDATPETIPWAEPALAILVAQSRLSALVERPDGLRSRHGGQQPRLSLLFLALTGSPAQAGFAAALRCVPYLILGLPADALVDRWNRKRTFMVARIGGRVLIRRRRHGRDQQTRAARRMSALRTEP